MTVIIWHVSAMQQKYSQNIQFTRKNVNINLFIVKKQCTFRRHNNSINITYTINMQHVSALLSHHQA